MPIKAVFVDLDGTLLNHNHEISEFTVDALHRLKTQSDALFVVATGRPYKDVFKTIELCHLSPDYIICSNGAHVFDSNLKLTVEHSIPPAVIRRLLSINVEEENGNANPKVRQTVSTNLYLADQWLCDYKISGLGKSYRADFQPVEVPDLAERELASLAGVHEVFFYAPHQNLLPVERELKTKFSSDVDVYFSLPHIIDVVPKDVNKSTALKELVAFLGIDLEDIIAFGDGMNDYSMLKAAGTGYVMANAQEKLKAAFPKENIVASNAEDGVAKKLIELFHLK